LWGNISSVSFNVTKAYSNAGALSFNALSLFNNAPVILSDYSQIAYGPIINAKVSGNRVITLPGVTGTQSGDSALSVPDASVSWFTGILTGAMSKDISGESQAGWPSITVTIQTDQGVVNP
jgi:hypothetical protein